MDDSWDIPQDENAAGGNPYLGTTELSEDRFPSFRGEPAERLKVSPHEASETHGVEGCRRLDMCQKPEACASMSEEEYWTDRLKGCRRGRFLVLEGRLGP